MSENQQAAEVSLTESKSYKLPEAKREKLRLYMRAYRDKRKRQAAQKAVGMGGEVSAPESSTVEAPSES
jgi:hypothetical protein